MYNFTGNKSRIMTALASMMVFVMVSLLAQSCRKGDDRSPPLATAPDGPERRSTETPATSGPAPWMNNTHNSDYSVIERRELFGTTVTETRSARADPSVPTVTAVAVTSSKVEQPTTPVVAHDPERDRIAVVGVVRISNETLAVMESVASGQTKFVPIGGEAFGYRVVSVGDGEATLSKNGIEYQVALGENKPEPGRPPARRVAQAEAVIQFEEAVIAEREAVAQKLNLYVGKVAATVDEVETHDVWTSVKRIAP